MGPFKFRKCIACALQSTLCAALWGGIVTLICQSVVKGLQHQGDHWLLHRIHLLYALPLFQSAPDVHQRKSNTHTHTKKRSLCQLGETIIVITVYNDGHA